MQDVPQFVLKRLREKTVAGSHPDADLLTAFAEQCLLGSERARVMDHLATCGDCRDIVALALPAPEIAVSPVSVIRVRRGWLGLPILRWGALAAGLTAVISVGVLQYTHNRNGDMVASIRPQEAVTLPSASSAAPSTQPAVSPTEGRKQASSALGDRASTGHKPAVEVGRRDRSASHDVVYAQSTQSASAPSAPPNPNGANSDSATLSQNLVAQNEAEQFPDGGNVTNLTSFEVVKAKDPVPAQAASNNAPVSPASASTLQTSPSLMLRALPRWTVTSSGVLQRSFDGGNTWENVSPALSEALIGSHPATQRAIEADAANSAQAKNQNAEVALDSGAVFHAVAAFGLEVWAGGSGGVLYHTSDGGTHWVRVTPSAAGARLTGDIIAIQFSGPQQGKISTSNAELWTTSDTGLTWQKQQ